MLTTGTVLLSIPHLPVLQQVREFLRRAGYAVLVAASAADAMQLLAGPWCGIDLLLAETPLPTAAELAHEAVARRPGVRVLLISGEPDYINREFAPEPWIAFIEKPFAWNDLNRTISSLLSARTPAPNPPSGGLTASCVS